MTFVGSIRLDHFEGCLLSHSIGNVLIGKSAEQMADTIRAHFPTTELQIVSPQEGIRYGEDARLSVQIAHQIKEISA